MKAVKHVQTGFSTPFMFIIAALVVIGIATVGIMVYHSDKTTKSPVNTSTTNPKQTTKKQTASTTDQTQQSATSYLDITQWGVELPLSSTISNAYYVLATNSTDTMWLGLTSLTGDCDATKSNTVTSEISAVGGLVKVSPTEIDPMRGVTYESEYPGAIVGDYYYGYISDTAGKTCATSSNLQSVDSAFSTAAKGIVAAPASTSAN